MYASNLFNIYGCSRHQPERKINLRNALGIHQSARWHKQRPLNITRARYKHRRPMFTALRTMDLRPRACIPLLTARKLPVLRGSPLRPPGRGS
jgi:hypothetical protein